MPRSPFHDFHVRLPEDVFSFLMDEKGDKSLNQAIIDRLRGAKAETDAGSLAAALTPVLDSVDPKDRDEFVGLVVRALEILAKGRTRRRRTHQPGAR